MVDDVEQCLDVVNAYAAPGGYIFISRGALVAMKNEAP